MRRGDLLRLDRAWADLAVGTEFVIEDARYRVDGVLYRFLNMAMRAIANSDLRTLVAVRVKITQSASHTEVGTYFTLSDADDVAFFTDRCHVIGRDESMSRVPMWITLLLTLAVLGAILYPILFPRPAFAMGSAVTSSGARPPRFRHTDAARPRPVIPSPTS